MSELQREEREEEVRRRRDTRAGVYVHVPFCDRVCPYCDFAVSSVRQVPHEAYLEALLREWGARAGDLSGRRVETIYLGGGTPSRWDAACVARLLDEVRGALEAPGRVSEVTLEANPTDVVARNVSVWKDCGITRVSLGCQSFQDEVLASLGRNHSGEQAREALARLGEGGFRVSLDLIFGAPGQTLAQWEADLDVVCELVSRGWVRHVSAYNLTIEAGTPFARRVERGMMEVAPEERCVAMVARLRERLAAVGVMPYEVSSWSVPGEESHHNSAYWQGAEYLGLGVGAHSLRIDERGVFRRANARGLAGYLADPLGSHESERLTREEHLEERVFVGVRSRFGLCLEELAHQFASWGEGEAIARRAGALIDGGLLEREGSVLRPSWEGMQVADMVGMALLGM